jgi:hypothetical protein
VDSFCGNWEPKRQKRTDRREENEEDVTIENLCTIIGRFGSI